MTSATSLLVVLALATSALTTDARLTSRCANALQRCGSGSGVTLCSLLSRRNSDTLLAAVSALCAIC